MRGINLLHLEFLMAQPVRSKGRQEGTLDRGTNEKGREHDGLSGSVKQ